MNSWQMAHDARANFLSPRKNEGGTARAKGTGARPLAGHRVLIVEDEFIIALELQASFEDAGAEIIGPAYTLAAALDLAAHAEISAATLDLRLARDSVRPVARVLAGRGIPFCFYSGQPAADETRAEWPQSKLISKPAGREHLIEAVTELVAQKH